MNNSADSTPTTTLRKTTFRSGIAVTVASQGVQFFSFISAIVLARLLEPSDFGTVGLAVLLIGTSHLFSGMGMLPALIASREETEKAAFHAFLITFASGLTFTVLVLLFADGFATWLDNTALARICRWMAVAVLLDALAIVPSALLAKKMMFGRRIIPRVSGALCSMGVSVTMAFMGYGLWSLVVGHVVGSAVTFAAMVAVCPTLRWLKPRPWEGRLAKDLSRFGVTSMSTGLVQYAYDHGDDLIVGKMLGVTSLGFYHQAWKLSNLPVQNISRVVNTVLLPAYRKIQGESDRLARAFLGGFRAVSAVTIPLAMGLFLLAPEFVIFLIGEKWRNSIPILQVFAFMSLLRPVSGTTSPLFLALGKPQYNLRTAIVQGVSMAALIFPSLRWGATGVAMAVVTAFGLGFVHNIYLTCRRTGLPITLRSLVGQLWPIAASTVVMVAVVRSLKRPLLHMVGGVHNAISLTLLVLAGVVTYTAVLSLLKKSLVVEMLDLVLSSTGLGSLARRLKSRLGRFLPGRARAQALVEGYPDGLLPDQLEPLARRFLGDGPLRVSHQHLSGWKQSGAFRLVVRAGGNRDWSVVFKNARYGGHEIAALEGLPVAPGPPEYAVYAARRSGLDRFLPQIHMSREVLPGRHYQYLMEDLARDYYKSKDEKCLLSLCQRLPAVHDALAEALPQIGRGRLLTFDGGFGAGLLEYAGANLRRLARSGDVPQVSELLAMWDHVEQIYTRLSDDVYASDAVGPIHGDLNVTNVLYARRDNTQIKLIDWEWAGWGIRYSDLASLLKTVPEDLESRALATYARAAGTKRPETVYLWCKLQRALFDASFFAKQRMDSNVRSELGLERHIVKALRRAASAVARLDGRK